MSNRKYIEMAMTIDPEVGEAFIETLNLLDLDKPDELPSKPAFFIDGHTLTVGVQVRDSDPIFAYTTAMDVLYGTLDKAGVADSDLASPFHISLVDTELLTRNVLGQTGEYDEDDDEDGQDGEPGFGLDGDDPFPVWDGDGDNQLVAAGAVAEAATA